MNDAARRPSIYVSADMEGCATLVHWDEVLPADSPAYERSRWLMAREVDAALEGAFAAGAIGAFVNDAHSAMRNIVGTGLDRRAQQISGRSKPLYMLEGIDSQRDAIAFFIGYHGAIGDAKAVMAHTYNPRVIFGCRLSGVAVGEITINAALAGHYDVPVALVSGDSTTLAEAERTIPWALRVETKTSLSYYAASCLSPQFVQDALRAAGADAVRQASSAKLFTLPTPITLEVDTLSSSQADALDGLAGFSRYGARTVAYTGNDMPSVYRALRAIIYLGAAA